MTTDPTRAAEIVVEQRHRDAAADLIDWQQAATREWDNARHFFDAGFADGIRRGIWDEHEVVQSFARFEASLRPATPSPVTDEAVVSGEDRPDFSFHRVLREMRNGMTAHKWWRKVDGTPAQNDLPVIAANIAIRLLQEQRNG